ncbi:MAG: hypothetical protein AB8A40_07630 [Prochlorococcus sp.]
MADEKSDGMGIGGNQAFGIAHTYHFKTMPIINTDYKNTELLDQELTAEELSEVTGGFGLGTYFVIWWLSQPSKDTSAYL